MAFLLIMANYDGKGERAVDQHGAQCDDKGRHFAKPDQKPVNEAAESAGCQGGEDHEEHIVRQVKHHNGNAGAQHKGGTNRQVNLPGDDDKRHAKGNGADNTGVLAAEDGCNVTEFKGVAVGVDRKRVADHDDQQNEDIAVLAPDSAQLLAETVVIHGCCPPELSQ